MMMKKPLAAALFWCAGSVAMAGNTPVTFQIDRTLSPSPVCVLRLTSGPCAIIGYVSSANVWTPTGPGGNSFAASAYTDTTNAGNISSGTLPAARLPTPTTSALGGVKAGAAPLNQYQTGVGTDGIPTFAQPQFTNIGGQITSAQVPSALALNSPSLTGTPNTPSLAGYLYGNGGLGWTASSTIPTTVLSGALQAAQFPALTGDVTTAGGSLTTTLATVNANTGTFGGSSTIPVLTLDGKGRVTAASTASVIAPAGTLSGNTLNSGLINSSLQTFAAGAAYNNLATNSVDPGKMSQAAAKTLRGNLTASTANVADSTLSAHMAAAFGTTPGQMLCYDSTNGWSPIAAATGASQVLTYGAAGSCPTPQSPTAAVSAPRSSVRQTVQGGPQSGGAPSFLPPSSGTLSITSQNISASAPLTVAAAQGSNTTGQADIVSQITSNLTWSSLPSSSTIYLAINASNGSAVSLPYQPIYQFGGTSSTVNGQYTFDYESMIGYLGNGSTANIVSLVVVGEVVTSASAVTSAIAYAYNGYYDSGFTSTFPTSGVTKASNLGIVPENLKYVLQNITAEAGYVPGDQLVNGVAQGSTGYAQVVPYATRNVVGLPVAGAQFIINKTSGAVSAGATPANWKYKLVAQRGW